MKSYYWDFYDHADSKKSESMKWTRIFNRMQYDDFDILSYDGISYWIREKIYTRIISQELKRELGKFMNTKGVLFLD